MRISRGLLLLILFSSIGCMTREDLADDAFERGNDALDQHDYDKAIAEFSEAIKHDPQDSAAYHNRAHAYAEKKEYAKAIADYTEAIRLTPEDPDSTTSLAWLLATCPDDKLRNGKRAIELATKAGDLNRWKDANDMENLAAGHAECGQFDEAVKWQTKALDVTVGLLSVDEAQRRLRLYKAGKPFREK